MESFFEAVAAWADERQIKVVLRREEYEWNAVVVFKDHIGAFEAVVRGLTPHPKIKASKGKPGRDAETPEDFNKRVAQALTEATVKARRSRIGMMFKKAA